MFNYSSSRVGIVGVATWLRAGRSINRGLIPGRGKILSLLYNVQTDSGAHQASYMGALCDVFVGGKAAVA
jgi:hypothetical protein